MTGQSFLKLLRGETTAHRTYAFAERGAHGTGLPTNSANFDLARCVVTPAHKLIYTATWQLPYTPVDAAGDPFWKDLRARHDAGTLPKRFDEMYFRDQRPMFELYDLQHDPGEETNLSGKPETAKLERQLKGALQQWMILNHDFLPLPILPDQPRGGKGKKARPAAE
jgi:hypothetical protein